MLKVGNLINIKSDRTLCGFKRFKIIGETDKAIEIQTIHDSQIANSGHGHCWVPKKALFRADLLGVVKWEISGWFTDMADGTTKYILDL